jgi:hypothetical protein
MSRQPVDKLAKSKDPVTRDQYWEAMKGFDGHWFSISDIRKQTYTDRRTLLSYLECLIAGGYAERREADEAPEYRIIKPAKFAPRLRKDGSKVTQGQGNENMWRTMRMMRQFSPRDLSAHSTTAETSVSLLTARKYCELLVRVGYLRTVKKTGGRTDAIYKLIRNTGPKPPMVKRDKSIFDPNLQKIVKREDAA